MHQWTVQIRRQLRPWSSCGRLSEWGQCHWAKGSQMDRLCSVCSGLAVRPYSTYEDPGISLLEWQLEGTPHAQVPRPRQIATCGRARLGFHPEVCCVILARIMTVMQRSLSPRQELKNRWRGLSLAVSLPIQATSVQSMEFWLAYPHLRKMSGTRWSFEIERPFR